MSKLKIVVLYDRVLVDDTEEPTPSTEKSPVVRDQLALTVGDALRLQLVRRHDADKVQVERGLVAVGRGDARLPDAAPLQYLATLSQYLPSTRHFSSSLSHLSGLLVPPVQ